MGLGHFPFLTLAPQFQSHFQKFLEPNDSRLTPYGSTTLLKSPSRRQRWPLNWAASDATVAQGSTHRPPTPAGTQHPAKCLLAPPRQELA